MELLRGLTEWTANDGVKLDVRSTYIDGHEKPVFCLPSILMITHVKDATNKEKLVYCTEIERSPRIILYYDNEEK